jgi:hypothetical protein
MAKAHAGAASSAIQTLRQKADMARGIKTFPVGGGSRGG